MARVIWKVEITLRGSSFPLKRILESYDAESMMELMIVADSELDKESLPEMMSSYDWEITSRQVQVEE